MTELLVGLLVATGAYSVLYSLHQYITPKTHPKRTEPDPCSLGYKVGDVVLTRDRDGSTERHTITATHGDYLMSGKQIILPDHIIGGYRP